VIALILQDVLQVLQPAQDSVMPNTDAPGIFVIQPNINPAGQTILQKGRWINKELMSRITKSTYPVILGE
jgi:hypothetical protein